MVYSIFPRGDKEKVLSQLVNIQDDYPTFIVSDTFKRTSRKPGHMYTGFFHLQTKSVSKCTHSLMYLEKSRKVLLGGKLFLYQFRFQWLGACELTDRLIEEKLIIHCVYSGTCYKEFST